MNNTNTRSELTLFLLQLSAFLLPLGLIVPLFLSPGIEAILLRGEVSAYFSNLFNATYGLWSAAVLIGTLALSLGILRLVLRRSIKEHCSPKRTLLAFAIGAFSAAVLYCFFTFVISFITSGRAHQHPLGISWGLSLGLLFSLCLLLFGAWYLLLHTKGFHFPALLFDLITAAASFFMIMPLGGVAVGILSDLARFLEW